jgi:maltooligosyltrehalose trehalohydrolase
MNRVWAPSVSSLSLVTNTSTHKMIRDHAGWWRCNYQLEHGEEYTYQLDGNAPIPDPRSPWQPKGVHGKSRHIDHSRFPWSDDNWQPKPLPSAILYELHIGTFTPAGTFDAAIERLDHLVDLGVTHVEVMPIAEFEGDFGWGYDGVFLFAPHHSYGGPDGFKRFVDACHNRGLGVILDVVYNHLGPTGNYLPQYGPCFSSRHHTAWGSALNFDGPDSDEIRRIFCDNALMWLRDYHCDGLRLDAVHAILDTSAIPFLEQLATEVDELKAHLGRHMVLIAESDLNDPRVVRPWELGGFGMDAQWSDDIHHSLHTVLTGEREGYYADFGSLADLATSMEKPYVYAGRHSQFRRRRHGRPPIGLMAHRFVAYLQNHDQLGNRARGERVCHLVNPDRVKIGAALLLTSPYVPLLFQGEEWAASTPFRYFVDFRNEPDLAKAVVEGRQKEFGAFGWDPKEVPDPTTIDALQASQLRWEEVNDPEHADMFEWHRSLIELRRRIPAFTTGRLDYTSAECNEQENWLIIRRGPVTILCNFSEEVQEFDLSPGDKENLLASKPPLMLSGEGARLAPESVVILLEKCTANHNHDANRHTRLTRAAFI